MPPSPPTCLARPTRLAVTPQLPIRLPARLSARLPSAASLQRSALQVAAFQGPGAAGNANSSVPLLPGSTTAGGTSSSANATGASPGSNGTAAAAATGSDSAPRASASQLASIYILPRAFSLAQLAAMDGQVLGTQAGDQWQLAVHAAPSPSVRTTCLLDCCPAAGLLGLAACNLIGFATTPLRRLATPCPRVTHPSSRPYTGPVPRPAGCARLHHSLAQRPQHFSHHLGRPFHLPKPHSRWAGCGWVQLDGLDVAEPVSRLRAGLGEHARPLQSLSEWCSARCRLGKRAELVWNHACLRMAGPGRGHCRRSWQQHLALPLPNPAVYVINSTLHEPLASAIAGKNCSTSLQEAIRWARWGCWKTVEG